MDVVVIVMEHYLYNNMISYCVPWYSKIQTVIHLYSWVKYKMFVEL